MDARRRRVLEVVLGLALAFVLLGSVVVIWETFRGRFGDKITVHAQLAQAGDALELGDIVTYKDVVVGEVSAAAGNLSGGAVATLKIDRTQAGVIPSNVTAIAVPQSLFGLTRIELVPPVKPSGTMLGDKAVIKPDLSPAAESLQTALANAYTLLTSVHPAQLDAALGSLATALQGQGENLGKLITQADAYLRALAPELPSLNETVRSLATVTQEVAKNAPQLLDTLGNALVVSKSILADKQAVASLLSVAPGAVSDAQSLLTQRTVNNAVTIFTNEVPVLQAFAAKPDALPQTIAGLQQFAKTFAEISSSGPYLNIDLVLTGVNFAQLLQVESGGTGHVFDAISDPPLYTNANCPHYDGASGPDCVSVTHGGKVVAQMIGTGASYGGTSSSVGSPSEVAVLAHADSLLTGKQTTPQQASIVDILLGPLLRGLPAVVR
jgi:phospholipid/cholesterol/gamma-HCH transport system substrate-binding protein